MGSSSLSENRTSSPCSVKNSCFLFVGVFFFNRDAEGKAQVQTGCMEKADTGTPAQGGGQQGRGVS